jgi:hypothetical protein
MHHISIECSRAGRLQIFPIVDSFRVVVLSVVASRLVVQVAEEVVEVSIQPNQHRNRSHRLLSLTQ